jgi:hypothetical protein
MDDDAHGVSRLCEVRATFDDPARMQVAIGNLIVSGFDRADLTLPAEGHSLDEARPESDVKPAATEEDARQMRTLGSSTAGAAAAIAAVGVTIATGGAAAPAVAAAVIAGGIAGGATFAAVGTAAQSEQMVRDDQAASGDLILSIRTVSAAKVAKARDIATAAGATDVETIE